MACGEGRDRIGVAHTERWGFSGRAWPHRRATAGGHSQVAVHNEEDS